MKRKVIIAVLCAVVVLTVMSHLRWNRALKYPLYPGRFLSSVAVNGHVQTLTRDKVEFTIEILTNIAVYGVVSLVVLSRFSAR